MYTSFVHVITNTICYHIFKPYSALLVTSYCALRRKDSLCVVHTWFCVSRKGGTGGGGWDHPQGDMHMVAARLGCQSTGLGGPILALAAWTGLENATLTL